MNYWLEKLPQNSFFQTHRSFIVNFEHIVDFDHSTVHLSNPQPEYGNPIDTATYQATLHFFDDLLKMLHPFMPFITEELWQHLYIFIKCRHTS